MFTKIKNILIITGIAAILGTGVYSLYGGFDYENIYKNANVWYKVSTDPSNPGEIVALNMSSGYSICDEAYIYIAVNALDSDEEVFILFPNGGQWRTDPIDSVSVEIQKHFGELERDLRK